MKEIQDEQQKKIQTQNELPCDNETVYASSLQQKKISSPAYKSALRDNLLKRKLASKRKKQPDTK